MANRRNEPGRPERSGAGPVRRAALTGRVVIGRAKGVLAGRLQISTGDAFGSCRQRLAPAAGCGPSSSARSPAVPPRAAAHTYRPSGLGGDQRAGVST
jgi:hypothetical protein